MTEERLAAIRARLEAYERELGEGGDLDADIIESDGWDRPVAELFAHAAGYIRQLLPMVPMVLDVTASNGAVDAAPWLRLAELELRLGRLQRMTHDARVYVGERLPHRAAAALSDLALELDAAAVEARELATVARCDADLQLIGDLRRRL